MKEGGTEVHDRMEGSRKSVDLGSAEVASGELAEGGRGDACEGPWIYQRFRMVSRGWPISAVMPIRR